MIYVSKVWSCTLTICTTMRFIPHNSNPCEAGPDQRQIHKRFQVSVNLSYLRQSIHEKYFHSSAVKDSTLGRREESGYGLIGITLMLLWSNGHHTHAANSTPALPYESKVVVKFFTPGFCPKLISNIFSIPKFLHTHY